MSEVPDDVARLVVAARIVAYENQRPESLKELDEAAEAFAARVPWEGEPDVVVSAEDARAASRKLNDFVQGAIGRAALSEARGE